MTWFKVDDGFYSSRKVLSIPRRNRLAAVGLWTLAGNWSGRELTNGLVPGYVLDELGATETLIKALVDARLWLDHRPAEARSSLDQSDEGIEFVNWSQYQPTRAQVESNREKEREKKRRAREKRAGIPGGVPGGQDGESPGDSFLPDPTRPDPTNSSSNEELPSDAGGADAAGFSDEVKELCEYLAEKVRANGHKVGTVGVTWWQACDRLIRLDEYRPDQIRWLIDWTMRDEFWIPNIRSMPKLREKFSTLVAQAKQHPHGRGGTRGQQKQQEALARVARFAEEDRREQAGDGDRARNDLGGGWPGGHGSVGGGMAAIAR